ncbi:MAG: hypothetical protein HS101_10035 [Planctomycetia bacterium]|nr:hypothetical protein [Planctomycetia bacterium]
MMKTAHYFNSHIRFAPIAFVVCFGLTGLTPALRAQNAATSQPATTQPNDKANEQEDALARARREALKSLGKQQAAPSTAKPAVQPMKPTPPVEKPPVAPVVEQKPSPTQPPEAAAPATTQPAAETKEELTTPGEPVKAELTTLTFTMLSPDPAARSYRFDYDKTPWADVLTDFARMSGLPFISEPDPPISETLTFRSKGEMTYAEALQQLNELLVGRPLNKYLIKRQENFLVIKRLPDWMREIPPSLMFNSFEEMEATNPDPYDIVLVNLDCPEGWSPYEIIETFRPMFSDTYGTQVNGERLELTGMVWEHRRFRDVVFKLSGMKPGPPEGDPRPTLTIELKNARCADVQTMLRQLYPIAAPTAPQRGPGLDPTAETAKKVDIIADVKNNRLFVKAPARLLSEIEQMSARLDIGSGPMLPVMKVVALEYADANSLTGMLKPIFMKEQQALLKPDGSFVSVDQRAALERDIFPDATSNSVVLIGGEEGVAAAEKLVKEWDKPGENSLDEIVKLKHTDANEIAGILSQVFPPQAKPGKMPDRITVRSADTLLLSVSKQTFEKALALIEKLDVPSGDEEKEHLVQPKAAAPSALAAILQQAISGTGSPRPAQQMAGKRPGQPMQVTSLAGGGAGPRFIPDDSTGYLIIYSTDADWERIEPLLNTLDGKAASKEPRFETFILEKARAQDVVNLLQQMFPPEPVVAGQPVAQVQQSFFTDLYNNGVQVFAPDEFIQRITPFIKRLDIETTGPLTIIKLEYSDAETIAPILAESVGGTSVSTGAPSRAVPIRRGRPQPGQPVAAQQAQAIDPTGGSIRIVPEPITNTLLVTAPDKELVQIRDLVKQIEEEARVQKDKVEPTRVLLTAQSRPAEEIVETLRYLAETPQQLPGGPRAASKEVEAAQSEGLKIVASGQQVIIDGPRDQVAKAVQLFQEIDSPHEPMIFRKYAVVDAEGDEKKLRTLLSQSAESTIKTETTPTGRPQRMNRQPTPAAKVSAPESILIYADVDENTLLVGARLESDLKEVERILEIIFADASEVKGGREVNSLELGFMLVKLENTKAFDIAFDLEDILNPDNKSGGLKFDEGPTEKTLLIRNCKSTQEARVREVIKIFDVPEKPGFARKNFRMFSSEKMPPEMLVGRLQQQYDKPIKLIPLGDATGRVKVIDIHEGEEDDSGVSPCVLPMSMINSLQSLSLGQSDAKSGDSDLLDPAVCPICHQSPCTLPAQLLRSLDSVSMAGFDSQPEEEKQSGKREFSTGERQHNHPVEPNAEASTDEVNQVEILYDAETGKIILKGPEEELEKIELMLEDIEDEEQPTVFRVFPLKYADVVTAAQLLEQVFNQGQAVAAGSRRGRGAQQPAPMPVPQPPPQPGQGGKGGQPNPQQQLQQLMAQQQAAQQQGPSRVKVVADPRTKSLFVAALLSDVPLIVDVLRKIDAPTDVFEKTIKIFRLENLDATQVVESLKEVLGVQSAAIARGAPQRGGRPGQPQPGQDQQQMLQLQNAQGQSVAVSADAIELSAEAQTNSIIAKAPPDTLTLIGDLIKDLESQDNTTVTEMRRVPLKFARATDVATIVKEVATQVTPRRGGSGRFGGRNGGGTTSSGVSVNADARTNSVIIAGQSKDVDRAAKIVEDMDIPADGGAIQQFAVKGSPSQMANTLKSLFSSGSQNDIVITGDDSTGTLLVKAPPAQMQEIADQIAKMDEKVADTKDIKTIKLLVADAEQVAPKLQEIFQAPRTGGAKQTVSIKGNKNNSMLYVTGADEETMKQIKEVATGMDLAPSGIQVRRFPMQNASAVEMNTQLTDMLAKAKMSGGLEGVKLDFVGAVPDPRTNSLIVTGGPITFLLIGDILKEVDVASPPDIARDTRTYELPISVDVNQVVQNIQSLFASAASQKTGLEPPTVAANVAGNLVIVTANGKQHEQIKTSVIDPIITAVGSSFEDYRINLKFIRAEDAEATLKKFMDQWWQSRGGKLQDRFAITADPGSNILLINCTPATKQIIDNQLVEMDIAGGIPETRTIQLQFARADQVAPAMMQTFQSKTTANTKGQWPVTVIAEVNSNSLVITAKTDLWPEVELLVKSLDVRDTAGERERRLFKLTYADPGSVSNAIRQAFQPVGRTPSPRDMVATADDWTTDSVVVTAAKDLMPEIESLVLKMDQPGDALRTEHVIELTNTNPQDVATSLQQILDASKMGQRQKPPAQIRAIPGTTKIIAYANEEEFEQISSLVEKIDRAEGGREVHTVVLPELVPAKNVAEAIKLLYGGGQGGPGAKDIKAEYHEPTNTIMVYATQAEFDKIKEQIIDKISTVPTIGAMKIYQIALHYAVADELAKTLQTFFDKKAGLKTGGQSNLPPWMRGNEPPSKAADNQVSIIAEPTSNTLLVYCTDATKALIDDIIKEIDVDPSTGSIMEMVPLKFVDATEMLDILTEYLKVAQRSPDSENKQFVPWWADREEKTEEKTVLAGGMRLKAIDSMNAIIVVGKTDSVRDAVAKIKELDIERPESGDAPQRIQLASANATELTDTLNKVFNDPNLAKSKGKNYVPPIIVAEEATKSLIVRAKPSDFNLIKKMAEGLDKEMEGDTGAGVRVLSVPTGRDLEELARNIEKRINDAENNRRQTQRDYKPSLVSIGADLRSSALVVAGSKGKYEEVKQLVIDLVSMAPAGNTQRRVIPLKSLSPQEAKQLIEQFQQSGKGKSSGPRSDATWTNQRRYEAPLQRKSPRRAMVAGSIPVFMMQVALSSAMAQADSQKPTTKPTGPMISTIRPRVATTQPTLEPQATATSQPRPATPASQSDPKKILESRIAEQGKLDISRMSDSAKEALGRKLSGAPISVAEAGSETIVVEASDEDMEVLISILEMLDTAIPDKRIEYVALQKASAQDIAKTLTDVFSKVEQKGERKVKPEDKVDIIADPRTNGLYIAATEAKMQKVMDLIEQNEKAAGAMLKQVKTFALKNRRVSEVGEVLKKMVSTYLSQKGLDPKLIGVEIDPQTNSVFVTANETDLSFVTQIIEGLDAALPPAEEGKEQPIGEADVMIIPLRIAQADTLGTLLNELLKKAGTGDTPMKDFIRRFRLLDEAGNPLATVNLDRPIVVFGDKDSNSLMIASTRQNCLIMKQVVAAFDKEPARAEVAYKVFTLANADATEVAEQINKLLTDGEKLTARPGKSEASGVPDGEAGSLVYRAVISADPRTNQVMLVGRPESLEVLSDLVTRLDQKGLDVMPFELVRLEYASVSALEKALSEMMKERAEALPKGTSANAGKSETVIIKGHPQSKSLIIAAKANRLEELKVLIKKLDIPSTLLMDDIRTITVKNTNATELADKLKDLWDQRAKQQDEGDGFKLETPAIVADERSNSLIVAAAKADFDAIKNVVDKIEALELNPMANIYVIRLKFNSAKQLQSAFQALFDKRAEMRTVEGKSRPEDKVAIEIDETTNAMLFAGSRENYDVLMQKVTELDQELGVPGVVEFFVCDNVGAHRVKDTIDELFKDNGIYKPGASSDSETAKKRDKVTVSIDDRSNMLLVSASPENMNLIREVYKRMNSVTTPWDVAITKMVIVEHGDSVKIAAQVADYFKKLDEIRDTGGSSGSSGGSSKSGFGITVFADERSNRIIVGGTKDGIDGAVELIKRLDVPPGTPGQLMEVYTLQEAPAAKIGEMIKKVFEERNKPREGGGDTGVQVPNVTVTVEPDNGRNALLINASREDHLLIRDLVTRLDRPSTILQMARVIALEKAPAERVKEILEELYKSGESGGEGGSSAKSIGVVEDKRTNSVVVTAAPGELENIVSLVKRLDQTEVKGQVEIGIYLCENEDAEKMADVLNQIMTGAAGEGGSGGSSASGDDAKRTLSSILVSYADKDPQGREIFLRTIRENVQITFNVRTNAIVAVAPPPALRLIEQLVTKLDQIQKRSVLVKVFMLRNADATKMVELLTDMFAQDEGAEDQAEFQRDRSVEVEGGSTSTGGAPTAASQEGSSRKGTFGRPKTTFVPDERTNSLIVAGWPEDIDVVADVIDQLDSRPIQDRDNFVYTLVNQTSDEMQGALQEYFDAEVQRLESLGETVSPQRLMEQEVSVISHPESNQLVVSASPRYKQQVISLIEQLDMAPPQVMIQVMIAEVSLDDRFEMGLEFALQELRFSETAVAGPNGILQSSHFDVVGGTDLGASGSGLGGFSFTITGEDFNFLVRALQADSRLEVIQRPMIMCQDNQQATIQIGQSVPTPSGAQTFGGQTSTQVQYQEVGVILNVEPHINPDGFVYMLVEPEVSSITDSTIQIAPGAFAPIFNRRTASTNVAVKDGETVVIGGLITTTENESESKVPLLGDIPGLGVLFRTTSRTKNRTELLIAMTPTVVRTVEDARRISIEKRDESGIITDEMKQSVLMGKLQVKAESADEIDSLEAPPELSPDAPLPEGTYMEDSEVLPAEPVKTKDQPDSDKPKYGPEPLKYGPMAPSGEDMVARRTTKELEVGR